MYSVIYKGVCMKSKETLSVLACTVGMGAIGFLAADLFDRNPDSLSREAVEEVAEECFAHFTPETQIVVKLPETCNTIRFALPVSFVTKYTPPSSGEIERTTDAIHYWELRPQDELPSAEQVFSQYQEREQVAEEADGRIQFAGSILFALGGLWVGISGVKNRRKLSELK